MALMNTHFGAERIAAWLSGGRKKVYFAGIGGVSMNSLAHITHLRGHIAANYIAFPDLQPPFLALAISGGNTLLVDVKSYTEMEIMGATCDDAAGECFDKVARVLGMRRPARHGVVRRRFQIPCSGEEALSQRAHLP